MISIPAFIFGVILGVAFNSSSIIKLIKYKSDYNKKKNKNNRFFNFYKIYTPDLLDKSSIVEFLEEAKYYIESDNELTTEAKDKLTKQTDEIIQNVKSKKPSWRVILGSIKELIIILGAVGSLAGGIVALEKAKEKFQEAENVIATSSCVRENTVFKNSIINLISYEKINKNQ